VSGIAFFDFDGTLSRRDSFLAFIRFAVGRAAYWRGLAWLSPWVLLHYLGRCSNDKLKARFFGYYFGGRAETELQAVGEQFAATCLPRLVRPALLARLRGHRAQDHRVVVLTASSPLWLAGWARAEGVELVGTAFEVRDGHYTGRLAGPNCHGERKRQLVAEYLARHPGLPTYGYGNLPADAPFLALLQHVTIL
jgi:HAD superfamily hydrolase (TIGR01490 family)